MQTNRALILGVALALATAGCGTLGPGSVRRNRLDYATALGDSWKQQTLLNIVKLRYLDAPIFLDVSSVISSYELATQISLESQIFPGSSPDTHHGIGAQGTYTDHPTISYTPLTGERFVNAMLRPLPPQAVLAMVDAGHPADFVFLAAVRSINDVYNANISPRRARRPNPVFFKVVQALRRIQLAGALGTRIEKQNGEQRMMIFFRPDVGPDVQEDVRLVEDTLGIQSAIHEYILSAGPHTRRPDEIVLLTRSMQEILVELSAGVDVPAEDLAEGRVLIMEMPKTADADRNRPLVRIRSAGEPPPDAYAAVQYRNHWFWIDDRDLDSKRVFMFLMMFSSLAETGTVPQVPIMTIPAN
jgi:hypothetical protein